MLAVLVFGFYWLIRLCALRCIAKWVSGRGKKIVSAATGAASGDDYRGVYYRPAVTGPELFVGQVLSDNLNAGSRTIASNKVCFSTPLPSLNFSKPYYPDFLPKRGGAAPVHDSGRERRYWSRRLSWLSSLIGYGLIGPCRLSLIR